MKSRGCSLTGLGADQLSQWRCPGCFELSDLMLILQALSAHEKGLKTAKDLHKLRSFPMRKYAVKA